MKKKYCAQYYNTPYTDSTTLSKEEFFQVKQKKRSNNIILSVVAENGISGPSCAWLFSAWDEKETLNTDSATLSKEEFFQVKRKKTSNNIMLSVVAKNGIIESILLIEAIWPRSVEDNNLRHRYEVLRIGDKANLICKRTVDDFKMIAAIKQIHNINALKKPNMDDHQLKAEKKQVESNESIEETKQDEQAEEAIAKSNANDVIEILVELTVTGSESERDEETEAAERVRNIILPSEEIWIRKIFE
ncbi:hypothetical protein T12_10486 [Trichinella patagoniensis]|uniref:Uncharacterized protein n=2 Tax=Trichinella patagoniensis TaxID=990121 RepID=A0A0V0Z4Z6_9BILA|nr:hypothetical protein T12_10486 [Trichinella patagoniensis]